ncbi:MAG: transposase family protein, partial [Candidatus Caldatribacteriota bacterium]|nr:transposase family protein [Candidatus Caldatribacteriota bacterium]
KMNDKPPSIQEWKDLYEAAIQFKKMKCWDWMWDTDIFGVQNPVNGEIGYCCVMGGAGEHFALAVYQGSEGLYGYLSLQSGIKPSLQDILSLQKLLMASFEDRDILQKEDIRLTKKIGLKFSGSDSWPLFRSYQPGFYPWYLTGEEARYLTLCLWQAIDVSLRFKDDPKKLTPSTGNRYLVRVPKKNKTGLSWRDVWMEPFPLEKAEIIVEPVDEIRLEKIKRRIPDRQGVWEVDFFYYPNPIRDKKERPYYPYITLWVDQYSGFILSHHLEKPAESMSEFRRNFLKLAEKRKILPREILVKKEETLKLLEPIVSKLGINLRKVKKLEMLEEAQASMRGFAAGD